MNGLFKLFLIFFKIGAFTFGGGYAMLPIIYRELCEERDIIPQAEMEELVVLSQAMPGALAVNCATQTGYKLYGKLGAVVCALGVVLPSYLIIVCLAGVLLKYNDNHYVIGAFNGIRAVVVGMILAAAVKMLKPIAKDKIGIAIMLATVIAAVIIDINPIFFIIVGGIIGYIVASREESK